MVEEVKAEPMEEYEYVFIKQKDLFKKLGIDPKNKEIIGARLKDGYVYLKIEDAKQKAIRTLKISLKELREKLNIKDEIKKVDVKFEPLYFPIPIPPFYEKLPGAPGLEITLRAKRKLEKIL